MTNLIVKDNALIEASHKLNEAEMRLILLSILQGRKHCKNIEELRGKELIIHAEDYMEHFSGTRQGAYKALRQAVMGLFNAKWGYKYINEKGNKVVRYERFTQSAQYIEGEGVVSFKFADAIVPFLVELERNFTTYEIEQVAKLSSRYAMRLYEMIMQYFDKNTGKGLLKINITELRFRLGLLENEYSAMSDFKKRVFDNAISQINEKTHLTVSYTQRKQGRIIVGFDIVSKQKPSTKTSVKSSKKQKANTPIKMTDAQRSMFAQKLAYLPECSNLPGGQQSYAALTSYIYKDLANPERVDFYRPLLTSVGFEKNKHS